MSKSFFTMLCCLILSSAAWAQTTVEIGKIISLSVSTNVKATLHESDANKVVYRVIKGDEDDVVVKVSGDNLKIKVKNNSGLWGSNTKIEADIYTSNLSNISVSAGARLQSDDVFRAKDLSTSASSGASVELKINALSIDVDCSSGASVSMSGMTNEVSVDASSGSSAKLGDLKSKHARVDASSGSSVHVHAVESITAEASSGASVRYSGNPAKKDIDSSSSGSVSSKN